MTGYAPELLYVDGEMRRGWGFVHDSLGFFTWVGPRSKAPAQLLELPRRAVLPGLVNAHSHSFQRVIRGLTEARHPQYPHDDFWTWREAMYAAANTLSPDGVEAAARLVFTEMVTMGITCVGEFHYLHHQVDGLPYADPDELAHRVVAAAERAGIRLVLLRVAYARSGFKLPPNPRQQRFIDPSPDDVLEAVERLKARGIRVGVAPHSVRAVPHDWLEPLAGYAHKHELPLHMHISEQPAEIEQCRAEHGVTPVRLVADLLGPRFTAVHAIHLSDEDIDLVGEAKANVCACPTTERNLGDGVVQADRLLAAGAHLALGTDSQCQIDLLEDARQLDYHLRLSRLRRSLVSASNLLDSATVGGARSLCVPAGSLQAGRWADWVEIDLDHPALAVDDPAQALANIVYSCPHGAIAQVRVGGEARLRERRHPGAEQAVRDYRKEIFGG